MNDMDVGDKATNESNDWDHSGRLISMGAGITMDYCSPNFAGSQQEMINVCARCSLWHRSQITKGIPQDMDNWEFFLCHVTFLVILKLSGTTQFDRTMPQW